MRREIYKILIQIFCLHGLNNSNSETVNIPIALYP